MKQKQWLWGVVILILVSAACNYPTTTLTPTPTDDLITQIARTVDVQMTQTAVAQFSQQSPTPANTAVMATLPPTVTLAPPLTALPVASDTPVPCNWAQFVSETIPDDSQIQAGTGFVKSWRLKNVGTCTWTTAYQLVFASGDAMGGAAVTAMTPITVPPGGTVDVSIALTAPAAPGSYQGFYKLRAPDGTIFGLGGGSSGAFWVKINSVGATVTPTSAPLPDLQITAINLSPASPTHGVAAHVSVTVYNAGPAATNGSFTVAWWGLDSFASPSCTWQINDNLAANSSKVVSCDYIYGAATPSSLSKAQADTTNSIAESNEGNNVLEISVTVQ